MNTRRAVRRQRLSYKFGSDDVSFCHQNRKAFVPLTPFNAGMLYAAPQNRMNSLRWFRRSLFIITLYSIGLTEAYYLPRYGYGIEWLLGALGATAFLAGFWMRAHRDIY